MAHTDPAANHTTLILGAVHDALFAHYGPQMWWPTRTGSAWEVMLGAVLTQHTSWSNVELALENLAVLWGEAVLRDPRIVLGADPQALAAAVRPAGFYSTKPGRLVTLARYVEAKGGLDVFISSGEPTSTLRGELLALNGIGPETADAILLYALKRPLFIADAYAARLCARWGLAAPNAPYGGVQAIFMHNLPPDAALYNEYHALIVQHAKTLCRPRPRCEACPLNRPLAVQGTDAGGGWRCPRLYTAHPLAASQVS